MKRRTFIRNTTLGGIALSISKIDRLDEIMPTADNIPRHKLGRAPDELSIIGFGGIMLNNNPQEFANENIAKAFDSGVNYYDVAPSYGNAIDKMGPALKPYRNKCFLACKTTKRDKQGAQNELNESLQKLNTDHFDVCQLHALTTVDEVNKAFGPDGAMETFVQAKRDGKVRLIGFSAHSVDAALRAMELYDFDTVLFPFNFVSWNNGNFGPQVLEKAKETNKGILALKSMALTRLKQGEEKVYPNCWYRPVMDDETLSMAFRYTLSLGVTAAVSPGEARLFWKGVEIAKRYKPITDTEKEKLMALAKITEPVFKA
jgi:predicted aldo/keto reductase-like oxidoreductase